MKTKRFLTFILCVLLVGSLFPTCVQATENITVDMGTEVSQSITDELSLQGETESSEQAYPAFSQSQTVDEVTVTVNADTGLFPEGALLSVSGAPVSQVEAAIEGEREDDVNVAASYTFDIKVLDADGREIQPKDGGLIRMSFTVPEAADVNLNTQVYRILDDGIAEAMYSDTDGQTVTVETEELSLFTLEFTYNRRNYDLQSQTSVKLSEILEKVGLSGSATAVECSAPDLFYASDESGEWIVTVLSDSAFSDKTMRVTINNVDYEIVISSEYDAGVTGSSAALDETPDVSLNEATDGDYVSAGPIKTETDTKGTKEVYVASWDELQNAINNADEEQIIKLSNDVINTEKKDRIKVRDKILTIDLAGYVLDRKLTSVTSNGHVIELQGSTVLTIKDTSVDQTGKITGGYSGYGGGIYINRDASLIIESGTISGNNAEDGGGIYVKGKLEIKGGSISLNNASKSGGGIFTTSDCTKISLSNADISGNTAQLNGGGINLKQMVDSTITDCNITNNKATNHGGGLLVDTKGATLTIGGTVFENNHSDHAGGGIRLRVGTITMGNSTESGNASFVSGNVSGTDAGGIDISADTTFTADNVTIKANKADGGVGGGLKNHGTVALTNCIVCGNSSTSDGGGVYSAKSLTIAGGIFGSTTISGKEVSGNDAAKKGGGIYIDKGSDATKIQGSLIVQGNKTPTSGSELFLNAGQKLALTGKLSDNAKVGVTIQDVTGTFTTGYYDHHRKVNPNDPDDPINPNTYFFSPENLDIVVDADGEVQFASTWKYLKEEIKRLEDDNDQNNNYIQLQQDYNASSNDDRLEFHKDFRIDLNGHTLNRNLSYRKDNGHVIEVFNGAELTIEDTSAEQTGKITGGFPTNGGGIYVNEKAKLKFISGTITGNRADEDGGGIYLKGELEMTGGSIIGNTADFSGGGIFVTSDCKQITLSSANISGNTAHLNGGGINMKQMVDSTITDCMITGNKASDNGGGLLVDMKGATLTIEGTSIERNESNHAGAGIRLRVGTIVMGKSTHNDNTSDPSGYNPTASGNISTLIGNISGTDAGGIDIANGSTFTATDVTITGNKAKKGVGGGVKNLGTATFENCIVSDNTASSDGGGIYSGMVLTIVGGFFGSCTIDDGSLGGQKIPGNSASYRGGGIYIDKDSKTTNIRGSIKAEDNTANYGKDIYLGKGQILTLTGKINGTNIDSMDMEETGIFTKGYSDNHKRSPNGEESENDPWNFFSTKEGAIPCIWSEDDTEVQLKSYWADLQDLINEAAEKGEQLNLKQDYVAGSTDVSLKINKNVMINLNGHTLNRNLTSKKEDGCIFEVSDGAELTVKDILVPGGEPGNGKITGGYATDGGGIYVKAGCKLNFQSGAITGNKADQSGGGIYAEGEIEMTGGIISENTANEGGGIYAENVLTLKGGTISGNSSDEDGGGIYTSSKCNSIDLSNTFITENDAGGHGGGINMKHMTDAAIRDCRIISNTSGKNGGGLLVDTKGGKLTISGTAIESNSSSRAGAGIRLRVGSIEMSGSTLSNNFSDTDAGGIDIASGTSFISNNIIISENIAASGNGGGVKNLGTAVFRACIVSGNSAQSGGGIYNNVEDGSKGDLSLEKCTIAGNESEEHGGGIYSSGILSVSDGTIGRAIVNDVQLSGNTSQVGGGIYVAKGTKNTNIKGNITVRNNTASDYGNDVYLSSGKKITLTGELTASASIGVDLEDYTGVLTVDYKDKCGTSIPKGRFIVKKGYYTSLNEDGEVEIISDWNSIKVKIENADDGAVIPIDKDYTAGASDDRIRIKDGKNITVNLNGHTLNRNRIKSDSYGQIFEVYDNATLTIKDEGSGNTGTITGGWASSGGAIYVSEKGMLNLQGGTITGNRATGFGGGIYADGTININGGTVRDNQAEKAGGGIGLGKKGKLNFDAGMVTGNRTDGKGGGIIVENGTKVFIKGAPVVKGNKAAVMGNDVYMYANSRLEMTGTLSESARIGVAIQDDWGAFTKHYSEYNVKDPALYFFSTEGYEVHKEYGEAVLGPETYGETEYADPFINRVDQIKTEEDALSSVNWMSGISGERYLNEINMPGTHDSGMNNIQTLKPTTHDWTSLLGAATIRNKTLGYEVGRYYARTQTTYIDQQLADGARQLDLRLNDSYKAFYWYMDGYWWKDDSKNLWVSHGDNIFAGNYLAWNADSDFLSFTEVLGIVKDFLKKHPSETIIINIRPQTTQKNREDTIYWRTRKILEETVLAINPSTGEPYLYKEPGSDDFFASYNHMPQLKDCRGKIVLVPEGSEYVDAVGGVKGSGDMFGTIEYTDPTHYKDTKYEKVREVLDAYASMNDGSVVLPSDADTDFNILWYWELNATGENQGIPKNYLSGVNPVKIAHYVNPRLVGENKVFGPKNTGKYIGWVRLDAFKSKYAEAIWRTNFFDGLQYCTVTVESGLGDPYTDQTFKVLKGTTIDIPGNIYKDREGRLQNKYFDYWKATGENTDTLCYQGDTFKIDEDVTFTAQWMGEGKTAIKIVWEDGDNVDGYRPQNLELDVAIIDKETNKVTTYPITLMEGEGWSYVVTGTVNSITPKWARVDLDVINPDGYGQDADEQYRCVMTHEGGTGYILTFCHTPQAKVDASGIVSWDDGDDIDGLRPDDVTVRLFADGNEVDSTAAAASNGWVFDFGTRAQYKTGKKVEYRIVEDDIEGYSINVDGFDILNQHKADKKDVTELLGYVEWDDGENKKDSRPEKITVHLWKGSSEAGMLQVSADEFGLWAFNFGEVPIADIEGNQITYKITVDEVAGYTSAVNSISDYVFQVSNALIVADEDKSDASVDEAPNGKELLYDGEGHELIAEGIGSGGTMLYALGGNATNEPLEAAFSEELPVGLTAGDYYVWYYVKGDAFHFDTAKKCLTVTIGKRPVTFAGRSDTKKYTGSEIEITGVSESGLIDGHTYNVEFSAKGTDVGGPYEGTITAEDDVVILSGDDDVSSNYDISVENGSLTIEQDPGLKFNVSLEGKEFTYDAKPHALPAVAVTDALSGETSVLYSKDGETWTGDLTELTATNVADSGTIYVRAANPNYSSEAATTAELTISKCPLTITATGQTFIYNGKLQGPDNVAYDSNFDEVVAVEGLQGNDALTSVRVDGKAKDVGVKEGVIVPQAATINERSEDEGNYTITYVSANLTIEPANITVTTGSGSKNYDGKALTNTRTSIKGLVNGETASVTAIGSQTDVGRSDNTCTIEWGDTDNKNYIVNEELGTLIVNPSKVTITVNDAFKAKGDSDPTITGTVEGVVEDGDLGEINYYRTNSDEEPGTYKDVLTADFTPNGNYDVTVNSGDFTIKQIFTVTWLDDDGSVLQSKTYIEGEEPPIYDGEKPAKKATVQFTYDFSDWDDGTVEGTVTTYKPLFNETVNEYIVRFETDGGSAVDPQKVEYGKIVKKPENPVRSGYTFAGWYKDKTLSASYDFAEKVTADTVIYAGWKKNTDPAQIMYTVVSGKNQNWTKGGNGTVKITVKRSAADETCFSHFAGVQIDNKPLAAGEYDAESGSTIVTLKAQTLNSLSTGKYTVAVIFDDGRAEAKLTVKAAQNPTQETDNPTQNPTQRTVQNPTQRITGNSTKAPNTGDGNLAGLWLALMACCILMGILGLVNRKRRQ